MHILHIALGGCLRAPPVIYGITPDTGGHIAYVMEAALAQSRRPEIDHVTIVTRRFRNEFLGLIHDQPVELVSDKVTILRIGPQNAPYREKDDAWADLTDLAAALHACATLLARRYDVIHTHFADAAFIGLALGKSLDLPVVYTPHALGIDKLAAGGTNCVALQGRIEREREAITSADGIVVSTRDEANKQIPRYGVQHRAGALRLIPPGAPTLATADAQHGRAFLSDYLQAPDRPVILAIARAVRKKNLAHLARAYALNQELQRSANLVILCGQHGGLQPGSEEHGVVTELRDIQSRSELGHCFALPAAHEAEDVAGLYRFARLTGGVFVNPALHEPFGLTLLEAASVGLPVIATNRGGPVDIIGTIGHGLLVAPDSLPALSQALEYVLGSRSLWESLSAAATRSADGLGWRDYARSTVDFYRLLLDNRVRATRTNISSRPLAASAPARSSVLGKTVVHDVIPGMLTAVHTEYMGVDA